WFQLAAIELSRYQRYNRPFSLLMLDLDHFKRVNDTFGHEAGDEVLRQFAEALRGLSRQADVIGRVGGEEFAVLLPETKGGAAHDVARRISEKCRTIEVHQPDGLVKFSCSIGLAEAMPADDTVEDVLR